MGYDMSLGSERLYMLKHYRVKMIAGTLDISAQGLE